MTRGFSRLSGSLTVPDRQRGLARWDFTKQRPIRLTETVFPSDRNRLVYELGNLDALYERDAP